ncbi:MAG: ImmA/IrrE family metallo-endopeptidase, partial [Gluconacetobacter diazotrophicus]|nr:ImmA/IrrE family metallo-endopeptidase [Gluconacetobacter diazotrophicus]
MAQPRIGATLRRLRQENGASQRELAARLGVSASYLNLIEHDQRAVTASLLFKLTDVLGVPIEALSGEGERQLALRLRDALSDPAIGGEPVPQADLDAIAARPAAARAVLALARAARLARDEAGAVALPGGRRIRMAADEVRQVYQERGNHFPALEAAADAMRERLGGENGLEPYLGHAVAERLRSAHGYVVRIGDAPVDGLGMHDHAGRTLRFSDRLPRESRVFRMAFQLATLDAAEAIDRVVAEVAPSSLEAETTIRVGLANYAAAALLMPYAAFAAAARETRYDLERLASRFGVSFEQAAQRASTLQRPGHKGIALFFASLDAAANVTKSVSLCGFPIAQHGGSCPRWVANTTF